jgi:hypothetical protein
MMRPPRPGFVDGHACRGVLVNPEHLRAALWNMERNGCVARDAEGRYSLTERGRDPWLNAWAGGGLRDLDTTASKRHREEREAQWRFESDLRFLLGRGYSPRLGRPPPGRVFVTQEQTRERLLYLREGVPETAVRVRTASTFVPRIDLEGA